MSNENRFCTNCGQPLTAGARFCGSCGRPTGTPSSSRSSTPENQASFSAQQSYAASASPRNERRIGIIPGISRKKGFMGMTAYNAIVTDGRIIFAVQTNEMVREETKKDRGGFFANMAGAMTAGYNIWKRYENMDPEEALHENPENFAINLNQIRKVKFDAGRTLYKKGVVSVGFNVNRDSDEPAHLEIETASEKLKFDVATHFQEEARTALKQAGLIK